MTAETLELRAGSDLRALDAVIAERVMGWRHVFEPEMPVRRVFFFSPDSIQNLRERGATLVEAESGDEDNAPRYTTDLNLAFRAYEELRKQTGARLILSHHPEHPAERQFQALLMMPTGKPWESGHAELPATAICLVLLEAAKR